MTNNNNNNNKTKICQYYCGKQLQWSEEKQWWIEIDNRDIVHTSKRCNYLQKKLGTGAIFIGVRNDMAQARRRTNNQISR